MFIALDGHNISLAEGTGIARYGKSLLENLQAIGCNTGILFGLNCNYSGDNLTMESAFFNSLAYFSQPKGVKYLSRYFNRPQLVEVVSTGFVDRASYSLDHADHVWNIKNLFVFASRYFAVTGKFLEITIPNLDVMHWTSALPIFARGAKNIYTVHDMIPVKIPRSVPGGGSNYLKICRKINELNCHVVTVSEHSKRDIVDLVGIPDERVHNNYLDLGGFGRKIESISHSDRLEMIKSIMGFEAKDYYLYFGAWEPKKNIENLIAAYFSSRTKSPLVICGAAGWGNEKERALLQGLRNIDNGKKVIDLSYLPDELLELVVWGAKATVFPSIYEGFGLPILESFALGTAVVASRGGSIPEISDDAAILVNAYSIAELSAAINLVDERSDIREDLEYKGLRRAQYFSSKSYQERLLRTYQAVTS